MKISGKTDFTEDASNVTPENTAFLLASISKTFLAVSVLQCVERGDFDLHTNINTYLARRNITVCHPHFPTASITAHHLLTHRSGLRDDESALHANSIWRRQGEDFLPSELEEYITSRFSGPSFRSPVPWSACHGPGEQCPYHYSNAGFALLGFVLQCAVDIPLPELVARDILRPLGMTRTAYMLAEMLQMPETHVAVPHNHSRRRVGNCLLLLYSLTLSCKIYVMF